MTVSTTNARYSYAANGSQTAFSFPRFAQEAADFVVTVTDEDGVEAVQTLTTNYTVTGAGTAWTITFSTAPASGSTVVIFRDPELVQETDFESEGDPLLAITNAEDRIYSALQALKDSTVQKSPGAPSSFDPTLPNPAGGAGYALGLNGTEDGLEWLTELTGATVSSAMVGGITAGSTGEGAREWSLPYRMANRAALAAASWAAGDAPNIVILEYRTAVNDGGGTYRLDTSDTVSLADGMRVIVDAASNRWKLVPSNAEEERLAKINRTLAACRPFPDRSIVSWYGIEPLRVSQSVTPGFEKTSDSSSGFSEAYYREFLAYLFTELHAEGVYLLYAEYLGLTFTDFGYSLGTHYDTTAAYTGYWAGLGSPSTTANFDWIRVTLEVAAAHGKGVIVPIGGRGGDTALLNDMYLIETGTLPTQSLTFGASTGSGVSCTAAGAVFTSADVGKRIFITTGAGEALITGFTSTTVVTVTIVTTISDTTPASQEWALRYSDVGTSGPIALTLSATSGASVTVTSSPLVTGFFTSYQIGKQITAGAGVGKITAVATNGQTCTISVSSTFSSTSIALAGWTLGSSLTTRKTNNYNALRAMAEDIWNRCGTYPSFWGWYDARETDHMASSAAAYSAVSQTAGTDANVASYGLPIMFSGASPIDLPYTATAAQISTFATSLNATGLDIWAPQTSSLYGYDYVTGINDWSTGTGTGIAQNLSQLATYFSVMRQAVDRANTWSLSQARNIRLWGLIEPMSMDGPNIGNDYPANFDSNIFLQMIRVGTYCDKLITGQSLGAFSKSTHSYRPKQSASGFVDYRTRAEALGTSMTTFVTRQKQKWEIARPPFVVYEDIIEGSTGSAPANATTDYTVGTVYPLHPAAELMLDVDLQLDTGTLTITTTVTAQLRINGTTVGVVTRLVEISGYWSPALRFTWRGRPEGASQAVTVRIIVPASASDFTIRGSQMRVREVLR